MNSNADQPFDAKAADGNASNGEPLDAAQLAEARLTAYVLGELDAEERTAVEKELADSQVARQQVGEIVHSVEMLTAALATEPMAGLPADRRQTIVESLSSHSPNGRSTLRQGRPRRRFRSYLLAASVLLCLTAGLAGLLLPEKQAAREAARRSVAKNNLYQPEHGALVSGVSKNQSEYRGQFAGGKPVYRDQSARLRSARIVTQHDVMRLGKAQTQSEASPPDPNSAIAEHAILEDAGGQSPLRSPKAVRLDTSESRSGLEGFREPPPQEGRFNTESYARIDENPFLDVRQNPLSTFSIDVDTAAYANVRRFLNAGSLPPKDAVRIEEMLNYFTYHDAPPADDKPFAVHAEVAGCPWEPKHRLLRIALKGREIDLENRPASNLVFLLDVSGSMDQPNKLPLLKNALRLLIDKLAENDRVAIVVYAGSSGLALASTSGLYKEAIVSALERLQAGGSTNGGEGIQLAYQVARQNLIRGGTNRVILCTDGDFNVGVTDEGSLTRLIETEAKSGVFLSVLGFGEGNLKDAAMEQLADRGNGNYAYIDTLQEARKVLVEQLGGTLVTIAKDVKLQLEFNPTQAAAYRLIGYENRLLRAEDFNDDKKDAGEIGAGHAVTALYELVPPGDATPAGKVDGLKYQRSPQPVDPGGDELLTLKLRFKEPEGETSRLLEHVVKDGGASYAQASEDFRFAASVAAFGLMLRDSQYKGNLTWQAILELATASRGGDEQGDRREMIELIEKAQHLSQ